MSLEEVQGFASVDGVYRIVAQSRHCSGSKKREERSRYIEVDNS